MNSIRYLNKVFSNSPNNIKTKAAQGVPEAEASPAKSTPTTQASLPTIGATSTTSARKSPPSTTLRCATATLTGCVTVQDEHDGNPDTSSSNDNRPKIQPKHQKQKDCHQKPTTQYIRPDYTSQMVFEELNDPDDPMPKGYIGTIGDIRYCCSTVEDYCPCGTGGGHYLTCGHTVVGAEACGAHCKTGPPEVLPFNCPQCYDIVDNIFKNNLTKEEQAKIEFLYSRKDSLAVGLAIGYITKHLPTAKGNIAETVVSIMMPHYGRTCQAVLANASQPQTLAELLQEHQSSLEQKTRGRFVEEKLGPLHTHEKRKGFEEPAKTARSAESQTPHVTDSSNSSKLAATAKKSNKKQKHKLETHREPISEQTRGTKRIGATDGELSDTETLVDNNGSSTANSSKKLKQKLETHPQPVTVRTRGKKRKLWVVNMGDVDSPQATKRTMSSFPHKSKEVAFLPIPPIQPPTRGELMHKRDQNILDEDTYSNKRRRSLKVLPGSDVEASVDVFKKKRPTLAEWVAAGDSDEL